MNKNRWLHGTGTMLCGTLMHKDILSFFSLLRWMFHYRHQFEKQKLYGNELDPSKDRAKTKTTERWTKAIFEIEANTQMSSYSHSYGKPNHIYTYIKGTNEL